MPNLPLPNCRIINLEVPIPKGYVVLWDNGNVDIHGDIKVAAMALAKEFLKDKEVISVIYNNSIKITCAEDKSVTIDWVYGHIRPPEEWNKFKKEFERIFRLKAFL